MSEYVELIRLVNSFAFGAVVLAVIWIFRERIIRILEIITGLALVLVMGVVCIAVPTLLGNIILEIFIHG